MTQPHAVTEQDMQVDESGGLYDDFDAQIVDIRFDFPRGEYQSAVLAGDKERESSPHIFLTLESPELSRNIDQNYSIGGKKGWEIGQDGASVTSKVNPENHQFHMSSFGGKLFTRMSEVIGKGDIKTGQQFLIQRGFFMTEAGMYIGLNFHWKREKLPQANSTKTSDVLMPVAFLGDTIVPDGKAPTGAAVDDDAIIMLVALATGVTDGVPKNDMGLKTAILKSDLKDNKKLITQVFNQGLLDTLVKEGRMARDSDGKFVNN